MTDESTPRSKSRPTSPERHAGAAAVYTVGVNEDDAARPIPRLSPACGPHCASSRALGTYFVGCDYDGTLSPIVSNPNEARPLPEAVSILRHLASLPDTTVAVIFWSCAARSRRDVTAPVEIDLVGSHGPSSTWPYSGLGEETVHRLEEVTAECVRITEGREGTLLEPKPSG